MRNWKTYITVYYFHFSGMAHVWRVRCWSEMSSLLGSQICVLVLQRSRQK